MGTLNKTSVREEIDKIKADFEQLSRESKVTAEGSALMKSLLLIVDLILSIFLEQQTKKNSQNSSIPSSQSEDDESASIQALRQWEPLFNQRERSMTRNGGD